MRGLVSWRRGYSNIANLAQVRELGPAIPSGGVANKNWLERCSRSLSAHNASHAQSLFRAADRRQKWILVQTDSNMIFLPQHAIISPTRLTRHIVANLVIVASFPNLTCPTYAVVQP
jgi:hypothetical protein